jgi:CheY-like chemotaxis protein
MEDASNEYRNKILIVEDEESNYELLKALLRKSDVDVYWAQNGTSAIDLCKEHNFKLVLMDIKMPEMNGYETAEILREKGYAFPIVAQTAYARIEDEAIILKKGFDGYISKPIDRTKFLSLISKFLDL